MVLASVVTVLCLLGEVDFLLTHILHNPYSHVIFRPPPGWFAVKLDLKPIHFGAEIEFRRCAWLMPHSAKWIPQRLETVLGSYPILHHTDFVTVILPISALHSRLFPH
jgi:hypothetical protein